MEMTARQSLGPLMRALMMGREKSNEMAKHGRDPLLMGIV